MALFSQSLFLQALGWATLNSFWQMALLWALFTVIQHFISLSSNQKYYLALAGLGTGFVWYTITFLVFYLNGPQGTLLASNHNLAPTSATWSIVLASASIAYLILLVFPAVRLFRNWQFVQKLRTQGLQKTDLPYRLFVRKVALRLGIQKPVHVYLSSLISSPVTVGFFKPIILLPVAALNHLSVQQAEAILLHELAHIRRSDFLINLIVTVLQTIFYYNPFLRKFATVIEAEREQCCDEMVLQFEYDKVSYATALLTLEKNATLAQALTVAAAGKSPLLKRIEKIVGMEQKPSFSFTHFAGIMASLLLVIFINSLLFVSKPNLARHKDLSLAAFENPFFSTDRGSQLLTPPPVYEVPGDLPAETIVAQATTAEPTQDQQPAIRRNQVAADVPAAEIAIDVEPMPSQGHFMTVAYNAAEQNTAIEERKTVARTVEATKEVLAKTQWQELEKEIADAMSETEKAQARMEYMRELEKINWKALEDKLKARYKDLDWQKINLNLHSALAAYELDSLQESYIALLKAIEKSERKGASTTCGATVLPLPDVTQTEIDAIKLQIRSRIDSIKILRNKEVISL